MPSISATIIAHNEEAHIARAIRSLSCAEEVVVIDSGSTDNTAQVAQSLGARVVAHGWDGFAAQKNFASAQAKHDWILSLDADEELDAAAINSVMQWKGATPAADGYRLARRAQYMGRWIFHSGWYPDYKIRLFDRRKSKWEGAYVHESVEVSGKVETLGGEILHYTCDSLAEHEERIEFYTDLAAQEMLDRGERVNPIARTLSPSWVFVNTYFFRLGVLDGHQGFNIARMAARYVRRKYSKFAELKRNARLEIKS